MCCKYIFTTVRDIIADQGLELSETQVYHIWRNTQSWFTVL